MNAQGFTLEEKDVVLSLYMVSSLYIMGNFYIRCKNKVLPRECQSFSDLQEYPFEDKSHNSFPI